MTSARLFIESKKLAKAVDEFILNLCKRTKRRFTVNAESDALLVSFHTHVILHNLRFSVQTFLIT